MPPQVAAAADASKAEASEQGLMRRVGRRGAVLWIAYFFPPASGLGLPGSQRAFRLSKHLPAHGWQPVVLTVREADYESNIVQEPSLLNGLDPSLTVVRTGVVHLLTRLLALKAKLKARLGRRSQTPPVTSSKVNPSAMYSRLERRDRGRYQGFKDFVTDLFEIPDQEVGWFLPAVMAGRRAVREHDIDVIFATGRPWTALVIGLVLKRLTGRPLVVEFRDPWMTNPFRINYSWLKNRLDAVLERCVVQGADLLVATTESLRREFIARFGKDFECKSVTILNGIDRDGFALGAQRREISANKFVLVHCGFLYGSRDPRPLIDAIKLLFDRGVLRPGDLRCDLVGSIELPYDLEAYLAAVGLQNDVVLHGQVPHSESLNAIARGDVAVLLQPGTDTQIPSKLYEYLEAGRPILAIVKKDGAAAQIVAENGLGVIADAENVHDVAQAIERCYLDWLHKRQPKITGAILDKLDVRLRAAELASELSKLTEARRSGAAS